VSNFKPYLSYHKEKPGESGYDREEREAREFYALPEEERERAMDARAAAILARSAKKFRIVLQLTKLSDPRIRQEP
jgi:hypothetical protein